MVRRRSRDRGIALILALLVLVLLVVLVGQMAIGTRQDRVLADNRLADLQNSYGARAAYHRAALVLQHDLELSPDVDFLGERWAAPLDFELGRAKVQALVLDAERFVSLAQLVNDKGEPNPVVAAQLKRLVRVLRHPQDVAERILDYVDADNKGPFESRARNERFLNAEELLRVEGLTPEILYGSTADGDVKKGLLEFVTVWPRTSSEGASAPGAVNVNTAPPEVLEALSDDMTPQLAAAIVAARTSSGQDGRPKGFQKVEELKGVQGLGGVYDQIAPVSLVKSSTFEIRARSGVGNVEKAWVFVARRDAKGLKLLSQQRQNELVTAKPPDPED